MKIEKLVLNYHEITKQVVLEWQQEVVKAEAGLYGDDYFLTQETEETKESKLMFQRLLKQISPNMGPEQLKERIQQEYKKRYPQKHIEGAKKKFAAKNQLVDALKSFLVNNWELSKTQPVRIDARRHLWHIGGDFNYQNLWLYQDAVYGIDGTYIDDEQKLLILEYSDRERRKFEQLKNKFSGKNSSDEIKYERIRIPEEVRIAVWRRDQGRCARCGSRENLEYDHIVPVSKGGTNTARNVELLCQNHNRTKGNRIE